jgi:hypothetical protein
MPIVDEHHTVSDKHFVLNGDAFAHERMRGNLALAANRRVLLDFDKRADPSPVADVAAVEIDEVGMMNNDIPAQSSARGYRHSHLG